MADTCRKCEKDVKVPIPCCGSVWCLECWSLHFEEGEKHVTGRGPLEPAKILTKKEWERGRG